MLESEYLIQTPMVHPSMKYTMEGTNDNSLPIKYYFMHAEASSRKAAEPHKQHANEHTKRRAGKQIYEWNWIEMYSAANQLALV